MRAPLSNGRNGRGQFTAGNRAAVGRGNPHAGRVHEWRAAFVEAVSEHRLRAVIDTLIAKAEAGEPWAVKELLDRCLGKPTQPLAAGGDPGARDVTLRLAFDESPGP